MYVVGVRQLFGCGLTDCRILGSWAKSPLVRGWLRCELWASAVLDGMSVNIFPKY